MSITTIQSLCVRCKEAIFNPLCPICIGKEIEQWIKEKINENKCEREKLKNILKKLKNFIHKNLLYFKSEKGCIKCKAYSVIMCPYCITEYVYELLKKEKLKKKLLRNFFILFNYDFDRTGYAKDFEI